MLCVVSMHVYIHIHYIRVCICISIDLPVYLSIYLPVYRTQACEIGICLVTVIFMFLAVVNVKHRNRKRNYRDCHGCCSYVSVLYFCSLKANLVLLFRFWN